MYICASLDDFGNCEVWAEYFGLLPPLSVSDALVLSSTALIVWVTAWGLRMVANAILNRW